MRDSKREVLLFCIAGAIPVAYFALLIAPYLDDGLAGMMNGFNKAMENPSKINLCEDSLKAVLIFFICIRTWDWNIFLNKAQLPQR